jgi:hypothetical protein
MTGDVRISEPLFRFGNDDLPDVIQQLVEERPAVFGFDRFELFDVDEDDADLALFDQHLFHAIEDERQAGERGGAIEQHGLDRGASGLHGLMAVVVRTFEHRLYALQHFLAIERFDEVVVGADLQAGQAILHVAAAGDQDHADARGALDGLQRLADFPAAALRHHHVEEHRVGHARLRHSERFLAIARRQNLAVERLQIHPQQLRDFFIIIGNQHDRPGHNLRVIIAENRPANKTALGVRRWAFGSHGLFTTPPKRLTPNAQRMRCDSI